MLTQIPAPQTGDRGTPLIEYLYALSRFCPYLRPSIEADLTAVVAYEAVGNLTQVQHDLFGVSVEQAELLRQRRVEHGRLACAVVVCEWTGAAPGHGQERLVEWPHWLLKNLYAPIGVMVGKYALGGSDPRFPRSPVTFLALRTAVPGHDGRFLAATPELAAQVESWSDDGRNPFDAVPSAAGIPATRQAATAAFDLVKAWAQPRRPPEGVTGRVTR